MIVFDTARGAKIRAALVVIVGLLTAVAAFLQAVAGVFPQYPKISAAAAVLVGVVSFVGRFTAVGDN